MSEKDSKILGSVIPNLDPIKIGLPDFSSIIDPVRELTKGIAEMQKANMGISPAAEDANPCFCLAKTVFIVGRGHQ